MYYSKERSWSDTIIKNTTSKKLQLQLNQLKFFKNKNF